jgi:hypothetical protein
MFDISLPALPFAIGDFSDVIGDITNDVAVPIGSLFLPTYRAIEVVTNTFRGWRSMNEVMSAHRKGQLKAAGEAIVKTALLVTLAAGFVLWFRAAYVISLSVDLYSQTYKLIRHAAKDEHDQAYRALITGYVDIMYLTAEVIAGPEVQLVVLFTSILSDLWEGVTALDEKRRTLGAAYLARPIIRCGLAHALPKQLIARWL